MIVFLVVLPVGFMTGAVAWGLLRKGGFTGLLLSALLGMVGGLVGFFAASVISPNLNQGVAALGAVIGAALANVIETIVLWRAPSDAGDPAVRHGPSSPINDPPVDGPAGRMRRSRTDGPLNDRPREA